MRTRLPTTGAIIVILFVLVSALLFFGAVLSVMRPIAGGW